ncbi:MAG: PDGLE domain-containing protein [Deltaproteobacteria bacterium]|nr:PDGLE domain-containing protein [Deltaproteobacteria bacterium]
MSPRSTWIGVLCLALAVSGGLALLASDAPDGLEHSLAAVGAPEGETFVAAPMPDYEIPFLASPLLRRSIAGLSGCLAVFGLAWLAGRCLRGRAGSEKKEA